MEPWQTAIWLSLQANERSRLAAVEARRAAEANGQSDAGNEQRGDEPESLAVQRGKRIFAIVYIIVLVSGLVTVGIAAGEAIASFSR